MTKKKLIDGALPPARDMRAAEAASVTKHSEEVVSTRQTIRAQMTSFGYGDGTPAPPLSPATVLQQQVASNRLALMLRKKLPDKLWVSIEADISPVLTRFILHYSHRPGFEPARTKTVEVDFGPDLPIDDLEWLQETADAALELVRSDASDLIHLQPLSYLRLIDQSGKTVYERGKPALTMTMSRSGDI